jgi:hypothetical protein
MSNCLDPAPNAEVRSWDRMNMCETDLVGLGKSDSHRANTMQPSDIDVKHARIIDKESKQFHQVLQDIALKHKAQILQAAACSTPSFTYACLNAKECIRTISTQSALQVKWFKSGYLNQHQTFFNMLKLYNPGVEHPIFIKTPTEFFYTLVCAVNDPNLFGVVTSNESSGSNVDKCMYFECTGDSLYLRTCARCLKARYCSKACQSNDWILHKLSCEQ